MTSCTPLFEDPIVLPRPSLPTLAADRGAAPDQPRDVYQPARPSAGPQVVPFTRPAAKAKIDSPDVPGPEETQATAERDRQADALNAAEIQAEMEVARRRSEERIKAMWAALETECLRMWGEVILARQKVMDELLDKWCKLLLG